MRADERTTGKRLAIIATHPIQYYSPWFRHLAWESGIRLRVFYLWDFGVSAQTDPDFGTEIEWDVDLMSGYEHEFVPNTARKPGTAYFFGFRNPDLESKLQDYDPDAILLMAYRYWGFIRLIAKARRWGVSLLFRGDSHRMVNARTVKSMISRPVIGSIFKRFAACLYVGRANKAYFRYHGVPEERLFHCPHAVDNQRFSAARESAKREARGLRLELDIPSQGLVVLFAGKFEQKKRPLDLLEAFKQVQRDDVFLVFAGDGELRGALEEAAKGLANVRLLPFQNQSRMPAIYALADLLALPSYGPSETWGLCVNEAMCMSRPALVSSHVGCHPDLIVEDETGWVFEAGNIDSFVAALARALSDRRHLAACGDRARERIGNFDYASATRGLRQALGAVTS